MSDKLLLGDLSYSSWSMRAGLLRDRFALPVAEAVVSFEAGDVAGQIAALVPVRTDPVRTVPALATADGALIWESLAVAEELASRYPEAGLWPADPSARATARSLAAEMHAGFGPLRTHCPMNLRTAYAHCDPTPEVLADVARIEALWTYALARHGGPWLAGDYSIADAFFAPVAARIAGYGLRVGAEARAYVDRHLADPAFRRWRTRGASGPTLARYVRDYPTVPWPGPAPIPAQAVATGPAVNAACPYSGKPVAHFAQIGGRVWGFGSPDCRDETVLDAAAWPAFMAMSGLEPA